MPHSETVSFLTASFSSQSAHARPESPCVLAVTVMWHTLCHSYPDTLIGWIITTNGNKLLSQNIYDFGLPSCNKKGCKKSAIHDVSYLCVPVWSLSLLLPQVQYTHRKNLNKKWGEDGAWNPKIQHHPTSTYKNLKNKLDLQALLLC